MFDHETEIRWEMMVSNVPELREIPVLLPIRIEIATFSPETLKEAAE